MSTQRPPSPAQVARANRQRIASAEGAQAMADVEKDNVAVRKNMARLRALRLAKEAEIAAQPPEVKAAAPRAKKKAKAAAPS